MRAREAEDEDRLGVREGMGEGPEGRDGREERWSCIC